MNPLNNVNYIDKFKSLGYHPFSQILIIGSAVLSFYNIRKNKDIDLWVSKLIYDQMVKDKRFVVDDKGICKTKDGKIEAHHTLSCVDKPFDHYLKNSVTVDRINFMNLRDVLSWKKCMNRPKDREDIKLIEKFIKEGGLVKMSISLRRGN